MVKEDQCLIMLRSQIFLVRYLGALLICLCYQHIHHGCPGLHLSRIPSPLLLLSTEILCAQQLPAPAVAIPGLLMSMEASSPVCGMFRWAWPICASPSKSFQEATIKADDGDLLGVGWCHLYRISSSSYIPHREAAASTAPIPLKRPGLVTSMCTGYFHSMYLVHPIDSSMSTIVVGWSQTWFNTHPNKRLYGQSTCPSRAQGPL